MLCKKLKFLREMYEFTHNQMSEALHLERSTYSYYELGKSEPSIETLIKLAQIYNVSTDYLLLDNIEILDYNRYKFVQTTKKSGIHHHSS